MVFDLVLVSLGIGGKWLTWRTTDENFKMILWVLVRNIFSGQFADIAFNELGPVVAFECVSARAIYIESRIYRNPGLDQTICEAPDTTEQIYSRCSAKPMLIIQGGL